MRTLHLISAPVVDARVPGNARACFGAMRACAEAVRAGQGEHRVVLLGGSGSAEQATLAGLRADRVVRPALGVAGLAWRGVGSERAWRADRVTLWSAGLGGLGRAPGAPAVIETAWAREASEPGAGEHTPGAAPCGRAEVRRAWGAQGEREIVVGLLADPPSDGDARQFAFLLGLVEVGVGPLVGVVSSGSTWLSRGRRFHRLTGRRSALLAVRGSLLPWAAACDVVVVQGSVSGRATPGAVHATRWALECGCVVIGPTWLEGVPDMAIGRRVFLTDGRTRTLLPAMMRALRVVGPWLPIEGGAAEVGAPAGVQQSAS